MGPKRPRRAHFVLVGGLVFVALVAVGAPPLPSSGSRAPAGAPTLEPFASPPAFAGWTAFRGSDNRSGFSPQDGPSTSAIAWYACPSTLGIRAGPVADAARVYVTDAGGTVYALDRLHNGTAVWTRTLNGFATEPELVGADLAVGSSSGTLYLLDAANGAVVWTASLGAAPVQSVLRVGSALFVGTAAGTVVGVDLARGSVVSRWVLGAPVAGALAWDGTALYADTTAGAVYALSPSGGTLWRASLPGPIANGVATSGGVVYVGGARATLDALWASNGSVRWRASLLAFHGTPGVGDGLAVVSTDSGWVYAYDALTGRPAWSYRTPTTNPTQVATGPAITPDGIYVVNDAIASLVDLAPTTGAVRWSSYLFNVSEAYPAVDRGDALVGTDGGCVWAFGPSGAPRAWPVTGVVVDRRGVPIAGGAVTGAGLLAPTARNGSFELNLTNGTYVLTATAPLHDPRSIRVAVAGPVKGLRFALPPLTLYPVSGVVRDGDSYRPVANARVALVGPFDYRESVVTGPTGRFALRAPNGTNAWSVVPPTGFATLAGYVVLSGRAAAPVVVLLSPLALAPSPVGPLDAAMWVPLAGVGLAAVTVRIWDARRRRLELGLPPAILSPFARYVAMRALLLPAQVAAVLAVLYIAGNVVLGWGTGHGPCGPAPSGICLTQQFFLGFATFAGNLFGGHWGTIALGAGGKGAPSLVVPIGQLFAWWLPYSLELAAIALAAAAAVAYPLGLLSGWRRAGALDGAVRFGAMAGVVAPSFLVALFVLVAVFPAYFAAFHDLPYGILPSSLWFHAHGGYPAWVGPAENTAPTGFPLVDSVANGAWSVAAQVWAKTLLQAAVIGLVYGAIFLRHARNIAYQGARESHVAAARARGVPESALVWRHVGRRVVPLYLLLFGLTLPAFVGTQAVVEAMFNDAGVGTLFLTGVTQVQASPGGVFAAVSSSVTQVAFFLIAIVVLVGRLAADVLARYLDPQLLRRDT